MFDGDTQLWEWSRLWLELDLTIKSHVFYTKRFKTITQEVDNDGLWDVTRRLGLRAAAQLLRAALAVLLQLHGSSFLLTAQQSSFSTYIKNKYLFSKMSQIKLVLRKITKPKVMNLGQELVRIRMGGHWHSWERDERRWVGGAIEGQYTCVWNHQSTKFILSLHNLFLSTFRHLFEVISLKSCGSSSWKQ